MRSPRMTKQKTNASIIAWTSRIRSRPAVYVAQPGMASVVASRRKMVTTRPTMASEGQADGHHQQADADDLAIDRDGAQAVGHQRDEVHRRPAAEPPGALRRDRAVGLPRVEGGGGVVVPELGDRHQALQPPARDGAEVAHPDPLAGQQEVQLPVEEVEEPERRATPSAGSARRRRSTCPLLAEPWRAGGARPRAHPRRRRPSPRRPRTRPRSAPGGTPGRWRSPADGPGSAAGSSTSTRRRAR